MGLDITAYSWLTAVGRHATDYCESEDHVNAFAYGDFPQSFRGIPVLGTTEHGSGVMFLEGGCYGLTAETKTHGFRAGSYGGYNRWRADLREQFNPETNPDGPFYELIWFADNEGCIGPEAALDLLDDFRYHATKYAPGADLRESYARAVYEDWARAFELGADSGLVVFH